MGDILKALGEGRVVLEGTNKKHQLLKGGFASREYGDWYFLDNRDLGSLVRRIVSEPERFRVRGCDTVVVV